ncbi:hypothetical protein D3C78_1038370 [compost metagenome]
MAGACSPEATGSCANSSASSCNNAASCSASEGAAAKSTIERYSVACCNTPCSKVGHPWVGPRLLSPISRCKALTSRCRLMYSTPSGPKVEPCTASGLYKVTAPGGTSRCMPSSQMCSCPDRLAPSTSSSWVWRGKLAALARTQDDSTRPQRCRGSAIRAMARFRKRIIATTLADDPAALQSLGGAMIY